MIIMGEQTYDQRRSQVGHVTGRHADLAAGEIANAWASFASSRACGAASEAAVTTASTAIDASAIFSSHGWLVAFSLARPAQEIFAVLGELFREAQRIGVIHGVVLDIGLGLKAIDKQRWMRRKEAPEIWRVPACLIEIECALGIEHLPCIASGYAGVDIGLCKRWATLLSPRIAKCDDVTPLQDGSERRASPAHARCHL